MRASELVALALENGWSEGRQKGSHVTLVKPGERTVTVPISGRAREELRPDVVRYVMRQLGLSGSGSTR